MNIQKPLGTKGKRNQPRIDKEEIEDDFVIEFPLTSFQKEAIEVIYQMRAVTTSQIAAITGYNIKYVRSSLLELYQNRFVLRLNPPKDFTKSGSKEMYYLLDDAGAIYISGAYEIASKELKWSKRENLVKYDTLLHTFRVSQTRAAIEKEARRKKHRIIECWSDRHLHMNFTYEDQKMYIRPDLYFAYQDDKKIYKFLVEVDRGTESIQGFTKNSKSFDTKIPAYDRFKLSKEYKDYFDVFPRILILTNSTNRAIKIRDAIKQKQQTKAEFLVGMFDLWDENCTGKIFMRTDPDSPDGVLTSIFE